VTRWTRIPAYTVPQIIGGGCNEAQAYLMRFCQGGHVFLDLCSKDRRSRALCCACRWLAAAYHGATVQGTRPFSPQIHWFNHLQRLVARIESGQRRINGNAALCGLCGPHWPD